MLQPLLNISKNYQPYPSLTVGEHRQFGEIVTLGVHTAHRAVLRFSFEAPESEALARFQFGDLERGTLSVIPQHCLQAPVQHRIELDSHQEKLSVIVLVY